MATNPTQPTTTEEQPDWEKPCGRCGHTITRYRGMVYVYCGECGAEHNAGGQRLRDDWRGNPSSWDEDISDLEGYEMQHADDDEEALDSFLLNAWEDCMRSARNARGHEPARHAWLLDQARQLRTSLLTIRKAGA